MINYKVILATLVIVISGSNLMAQDVISPSRKQAIDSLALEKVRDLSKYVSIVGNKDTPWSEANRVIERTLELFAEGALMGVSSINREEVNYYGVREYLERLMALNYDKVNIQWYNIQYISDLERQPDGKYVGVITIYQRFEGTTKEGLKYVDVTKKDVTVYVERKTTQISGRLIGFWDVLLGDIRVTETKPGE
jgi:ABC-type antimicrobial peptide transport system permease subunit